jgi:hypothetical protein
VDRFLQSEKRALDVGAEHGIKALLAQVLDRLRDTNPRIGKESIEPAKLFFDLSISCS